jgi:hypothetical protein
MIIHRDILAAKADNLTAKCDPTIRKFGTSNSDRLNINHGLLDR